MLGFSCKLKSAPLFLFFSLSLLLSLTSCKGDLEVDPMVASSNQTRVNAFVSTNSGSIAPGDLTLVELASDTDLNEFVAALTYVDSSLNAGLVDLFSDTTRAYTIFAPTDAAFQAFYAREGVTSVTELSPEAVNDILLYHVTRGRQESAVLVPEKNVNNIPTLLRLWIGIDREANILANGSEATFVQPDSSASNGLIHVIDDVLIP